MARKSKNNQPLKIRYTFKKPENEVEAEAQEAALSGAFDLLFKEVLKENERKKQLKKFPKGFQLEESGHSCRICGRSTPEGGNWYDKYGVKCLVCQGAIDRKEIPVSAAKDRESWYSELDLQKFFNADRTVLKRLIKKDILKARTIVNIDGSVYTRLFLIEDNKDTLPPKKMLESHTVKETKDGKEWYCSESWYRFVDPRKYLKNYKIINYLQWSKE